MKKIILPINQKSLSKDSIVISCSLHLYRNIDGLDFTSKLSQTHKSQVAQQLLEIIQKTNDHDTYTVYYTSEMKDLEKLQLTNQLILPHKTFEHCSFIIASTDGTWVLLPNYEDHITVYSFAYGTSFKHLYKHINNIVSELDSHIHYAYSPEIGFLSPSLSHAGNGLFISTLLNLAASELKGQISLLQNTCSETGYILEPYTKQPNSPLYILKNKGSFGINEKDHLEHMGQVIDKLQEHEKSARVDILSDEENKELLVSQINSFYQENTISYEDCCHFIATVDLLDKKLYNIQDRQQWFELLFTLKDNSTKLIGLPKEDQQLYRANLLKYTFNQLVTLKRG